MCSEVIIFFYYTKILKTAAISPLHTGHSETALEQLAQRQRWPHGTTAYSGSPSQQMAHSAVAGSVEAGLGGSGSSTSSSAFPYTPTPDCERDVHAGRVRGIGAIRGSRPCTRGAHVKPGAHLPSRCVGSFHSPLQKLAASPAVSRRRARSCRPTEGRGRLGGRQRRLPRPARGCLGARRRASTTCARPHTMWRTQRH